MEHKRRPLRSLKIEITVPLVPITRMNPNMKTPSPIWQSLGRKSFGALLGIFILLTSIQASGSGNGVSSSCDPNLPIGVDRVDSFYGAPPFEHCNLSGGHLYPNCNFQFTGERFTALDSGPSDFVRIGSYYAFFAYETLSQFQSAYPWATFIPGPGCGPNTNCEWRVEGCETNPCGGGGTPTPTPTPTAPPACAGEIVVEQPAGNSLTDNSTTPVTFPITNVGANTSLSFTIKDLDPGKALRVGAITVDGANAVDFTVTQNPTKDANGNLAFVVRFAPSSAGLRAATLHIANNDCDENPFDIRLNGSGQSAPTETISTPTVPTGPSNGDIGSASVYTYSTGGAVSSLGHAVQYLFNWDDGTSSGWLPVGTKTWSHYWSSTGQFRVQAIARSAADTSILSPYSGIQTMTIVASAGPTTFVVTSNSSSADVSGSLPAVIKKANAGHSVVNFIHFNIAQTSPEIVLIEPLTTQRLMVIDATTQPGPSGTPRIRINANGVGDAFQLVGQGSSGSTIQGFQIVNHTNSGVFVGEGSQGNWIQNNWVGFQLKPGATNFEKTLSRYPSANGILLESSFNTVRNNVIAGVANGVYIGVALSSGGGDAYKTNSIQQNFIGTDPAGSYKVGNSADGIFLGKGARENFLGPGNVISGQDGCGVRLLDSTNYGNIVIQNVIGLNAAGAQTIPNGGFGVMLANGATFNDVGGPSGGNVISGNALGGVVIGDGQYPGADGTNGNYVEFNLIGTNGSGLVSMNSPATGVTIQTKSKANTIRGNVIGGHLGHGVLLSDASSNGLFGNRIGTSNNSQPMSNHGFGVYLLDSSYNYIQMPPDLVKPGLERNIFGANDLGSIGISGISVGNLTQ